VNVAQSMCIVHQFACQMLVVYVAQALNCVRAGSTLLLVRDSQTVCASLYLFCQTPVSVHVFAHVVESHGLCLQQCFVGAHIAVAASAIVLLMFCAAFIIVQALGIRAWRRGDPGYGLLLAGARLGSSGTPMLTLASCSPLWYIEILIRVFTSVSLTFAIAFVTWP